MRKINQIPRFLFLPRSIVSPLVAQAQSLHKVSWLFHICLKKNTQQTDRYDNKTSCAVVPSHSALPLRCESTVQLHRLPHTDSFCLILPPNLKSAIAAVTYMAEQLKKQDTDDTVRNEHDTTTRAAFTLFVPFMCRSMLTLLNLRLY